MNKILGISCLVFPIIASAMNVNGMDQAQIQQMMQKMQDMQTCMANVDHAAMKAFGERAKQLGAEIKALCAAGNKAEALAKAKDFAQEAQANSALQTAKKCSEALPQVMPKILTHLSDNSEKSHKDICEQSLNNE